MPTTEPAAEPAATLVDTNVLLDVLTDDPAWFAWSGAALARAFDSGLVIINPVVYAEVSARFESIEKLDAALSPTMFIREDPPWEAAFLAGKAHAAYRRRGGARERTLPDFLIGAHAAIRGHRLLTRDTRRYRTAFPRLVIDAPQPT